MTKKKNKEIQPRDIIMGGIALLAIVMIINSISLINVKSKVYQKIAEMEETNRPVELSATIITVDCQNCFDIGETYSSFKESNVKITSESYLSSESGEAKALISTYQLETLPTILLQGEIDRFEPAGFEATGDALVYTEIKPPYVDAKTNEVKGEIEVILLEDSTCDICPDLSGIATGLESIGISLSSRVVDSKSSEGISLINDNKLEVLPSALISSDVSLYDGWQDVQAAVVGDYFLINVQGPYVNASTGEVRGEVNLVFLTDANCSDCYDPIINKQILPNFGVVEYSEETVTMQSEVGQELLRKYNITKVPTILISGDMEVYPALTQVWTSVGTIEEDSTYIFREMSALGDVKFTDLEAS